jgi:nucleoside-diphosphate-sugar epimerase
MTREGFVDETSPLAPISLYAELKVRFERYLLEGLLRKDFIATALRFATVYGLSARMRFDLTVNEFTRDLTLGRELLIFGEQFWRPYCHVDDLAASCITVLEAPSHIVAQNVFNVGDTSENYQKKMLAEELLKVVPNARIKYVARQEDPRDYRVRFDKIKHELDFKITKRVLEGIVEIHSALSQGVFTDPYSKTYSNI